MKHIALITFAALAVVLWSTPASAYIDPGTGSFLVQGIIAAVVGAGMVVKMHWERIKASFTGQSAQDDEDDE